MDNLLIILVIAAIVLGAALYIRKEKKKGAVCIGCPHSASCGKCKGNCSSCSDTHK